MRILASFRLQMNQLVMGGSSQHLGCGKRFLPQELIKLKFANHQGIHVLQSKMGPNEINVRVEHASLIKARFSRPKVAWSDKYLFQVHKSAGRRRETSGYTCNYWQASLKAPTSCLAGTVSMERTFNMTSRTHSCKDERALNSLIGLVVWYRIGRACNGQSLLPRMQIYTVYCARAVVESCSELVHNPDLCHESQAKATLSVGWASNRRVCDGPVPRGVVGNALSWGFVERDLKIGLGEG